jgi:hypothetical protein
MRRSIRGDQEGRGIAVSAVRSTFDAEARTMRYVLCCMLALGGCGVEALDSRASYYEMLAADRTRHGDLSGAEVAQLRADSLREAARQRALRPHGRFWHDVAVD